MFQIVVLLNCINGEVFQMTFEQDSSCAIEWQSGKKTIFSTSVL